MINPEELAICKRRGHNLVGPLMDTWTQCEACGMWVREVIEEREDTPPLEEQSAFNKLNRKKDF